MPSTNTVILGLLSSFKYVLVELSYIYKTITGQDVRPPPSAPVEHSGCLVCYHEEEL